MKDIILKDRGASQFNSIPQTGIKSLLSTKHNRVYQAVNRKMYNK